MAQPPHPVLQDQLQRHAQQRQQRAQLLQPVQPQPRVHRVLAAGVCDHGDCTGCGTHHHMPVLLGGARAGGDSVQVRVDRCCLRVGVWAGLVKWGFVQQQLHGLGGGIEWAAVCCAHELRLHFKVCDRILCVLTSTHIA